MRAQPPNYRAEVQGASDSFITHGLVALRMNDRWPARIPSVAELTAWIPMSRATAYRWRATLRAARGQE